MLCQNIMGLYSSPLRIVVAMGLLYSQLGAASLVALATLILFMPLQACPTPTHRIIGWDPLRIDPDPKSFFLAMTSTVTTDAWVVRGCMPPCVKKVYLGAIT